jgi:hypothetical protein
MKSKATIITLVIAFLLVLVSVSSAASSTQYTMDWTVHSAGSTSMSSSSYSLAGTAAQPVTGLSTSSTYGHCAGYWCGIDVQHTTHLPLITFDY